MGESLSDGGFEIRLAGTGDFGQVLSLEGRCFPPCDQMSAGDLDDFYRRFPEGLFILEKGGTFAGYALFTFEVPGVVYLESVAMEPAFRGQGAGSRVLGWARDHFGSRGFKTLHLHVRQGNKGAVSLYEKEGFIKTGTDPDFYEDGETALLYDLELN
jgi:ribosomal protein S18 acetylase RimI-like enzyme